MFRFEISPIGLVINVSTDITRTNYRYFDEAIKLASKDGMHVFVSLEACGTIDEVGLAVLRQTRARLSDRLHLIVGDGSTIESMLRGDPLTAHLVAIPAVNASMPTSRLTPPASTSKAGSCCPRPKGELHAQQRC
ncbi:MAG: hypothetical protein NVSMB64_21200 [Candidatus Velthaea sp.]